MSRNAHEAELSERHAKTGHYNLNLIQRLNLQTHQRWSVDFAGLTVAKL